MEQNLPQLGVLGVLFFLAIKEFFNYLKSRKNGIETDDAKSISAQLRVMNTNHLTHIEKAILEGNGKLLSQLHSDNQKIIELLARMEGKMGRN